MRNVKETKIPRRLNHHEYDKTNPCKYFDRASQGNLGPNGVGGWIQMLDGKNVSFILGLGHSTNNNAGKTRNDLGTLLKISWYIKIKHMVIFSGFHVCIQWLMGNNE